MALSQGNLPGLLANLPEYLIQAICTLQWSWAEPGTGAIGHGSPELLQMLVDSCHFCHLRDSC